MLADNHEGEFCLKKLNSKGEFETGRCMQCASECKLHVGINFSKTGTCCLAYIKRKGTKEKISTLLQVQTNLSRQIKSTLLMTCYRNKTVLSDNWLGQIKLGESSPQGPMDKA